LVVKLKISNINVVQSILRGLGRAYAVKWNITMGGSWWFKACG